MRIQYHIDISDLVYVLKSGEYCPPPPYLQNVDSVLSALIISRECHPLSLSGLFLFGVLYDITNASYVVDLPPDLLQVQTDLCLDAMLFEIP